jgi:outer membrane receptor protein involved in Fe transport
MKIVLLLFSVVVTTVLTAQHTLSGRVVEEEGTAVAYATVAAYRSVDSTLVQVETTDDSGIFRFRDMLGDDYDLVISLLGYRELRHPRVHLTEDHNLGVLTLNSTGVDLQTATVTAERVLVEVKPDRTVFNVNGTINAAGNDAITLLRMAPGVTVDNNDNISVLSRSGVIIYVDGRRVPLSGQDLSNYLRNLTAEQIDRIDIITSPGARYEAQGNAGIIDIRLKKAENEGANGSLTASGSQGRYAIYALNAGGNFRNRKLNVFGNVGFTSNESFTDNAFVSRQNGFLLTDDLLSRPESNTPSLRLGTDIYLDERQTLGFLYSGIFENLTRDVINSTIIRSGVGAPVDSILRGGVDGSGDHSRNTFNVNYNFAIGDGQNLNVDLDYGRYRNDDVLDQPNRYFNPAGDLLSMADAYFETPIDIDIYTARLDYDFSIGEGAASAGAKYTRVATENTFLAFDGLFDNRMLDADQSNIFNYDETVYAAYLSYAGAFSERLSYSAGLRMEATVADGLLMEIAGDNRTNPVDSNYLSLFPSAGLTYEASENATWSLRYGRRINRPDYNVLNPFRVQLNELSYERGNPRLRSEIVDNVELGYVLKKRYNFKVAYSHTAAALARLFSPDEENPRAGFATYDNLARQHVYAFTFSAPFTITGGWRAYANLGMSYIDNEADYGDQGTVNVELFSYQGLLQQTFTLPEAFRGEITAVYRGPGISQGIFEYEDFYLVNVGLQRRFFQNQLTAKLSVNDIFYSFRIEGESDFNGLRTRGNVIRDSRRVALSLSYTFGNQKVSSRRRDTGLDDAEGRIGG